MFLKSFFISLVSFSLLLSLDSSGCPSTPNNEVTSNIPDSLAIKASLNTLNSYKQQKLWKKVIALASKLEKDAEAKNNKALLSRVLKIKGDAYRSKGNLNESLSCLHKALLIEEQNENFVNQASLLYDISLLYTDLGYYALGLKYLYQGIRIAEKNSDSYNCSKLFYAVSLVYYIQKDYNTSQLYLSKADSVIRIAKNKELTPYIHKAKGALMVENKKFNEAYNEYNISQAGLDENGDTLGIASLLNNLGYLYLNQDQYKKALEYQKKSLKINQDLSEQTCVAVSLNSIAETYLRKGDIDSAYIYANKSMSAAMEFNMLYLQDLASQVIAAVYKKKGDFNRAFYWLSKSYEIHNSIFNDNTSRSIYQLERNLEFEKKFQDQALENQRRELELVDKAQRSKMIGQFLGVISALALLSLIIALYSIKQKKKHNLLLQEQKEEIQVQNEEIMAQRENLYDLNEELVQKNEVISESLEENERQRNSLANLAWELQEKAEVIEKQRDELFHSKKEITDSIVYAERIQNAILPTPEMVREVFPESFIFYRPKNIISGDFYWVSNIRGYKIFAIGDCTGHGVPGGIMSMLGIAYLSDIINKDHITKAGDVLEEMRRQIIESLHQYKKSDDDESYDGMDMAVCALNEATMELQFAGANLPIYIFKKGSPNDQDPIILREDRMPIAQFIKIEPFHNYTLQVEKGDMIYLFTDGYSDQFGGHAGKKYNLSKFRSLLASIHHLSAKEQEQAIISTFETWRGNMFQVDDVLVMGVRI